MPTSALFFLPATGLNLTSPTPLYTSLSTHLTLKHSTAPTTTTLPAYALEHRLYINTASLLPSSTTTTTTSQRQYTQFLHLPHLNAAKTYIGSSTPAPSSSAPNPSAPPQSHPSTNGPPMAILTTPTGPSGADAFADLLSRKMQPLWVPRPAVRVENGLALSLKDGMACVRVGEVKSAGQGGQGGVRGVIVELVYAGDDEGDEDEDDGEDDKGDDGGAGARNGQTGQEVQTQPATQEEGKQDGEKMDTDTAADSKPDPEKQASVQTGVPRANDEEEEEKEEDRRWTRRTALVEALFKALFRDCPGLSLDHLRVVCRAPAPAPASAVVDDLLLVRQYMELLRSARAGS